MDELQARIRTRRLQTDRNLAEQPYPEFDYPDEDQRQGEANVVEMPNRQAQGSSDAASSRSTAKRLQGAAKRQPATASQKAFPFRQMRDGHQQPYIDELKRLEAQAERINQLLAERKRKKAQSEQTMEPTSNESATPKKRTTKGRKPSSRSSPQPEVSPMLPQEDDTAALEAQAERIQQLLTELEAAIVQGDVLLPSDAIASSSGANLPPNEAIAASSGAAQPQLLDQLDQPTSVKLPSTAASVESFASNTYRYGANAQPLSGNPPVTPEADEKAQQEATETAQALRYLASRDVSREPVEPTIAAANPYEARRTARSGSTPSGSTPLRSSLPRSSQTRSAQTRSTQTLPGLLFMRQHGLQLRQFLQMPQKSFDKVGDAVLWIVLAAAIRVGARFLLAHMPILSPIFMLLMFAPAALAVYLVLFVPRAGFVSIYRLFLIMLGLLLGGRL